MNLTEIVTKQRILPIIMPTSVAQTMEDLGSYQQAGYHVLEILCRTPFAFESIKLARKTYPNLFIGAGTILSPEMENEAAAAGAQYIVSPAMDPAVSEAARKHGLPFVPGVCTPTDMAIGMREGYTLQKFFPAEQSGGLAWINAIASPYGHTPLRLIAGSGIVKANVESYWKNPLIAAIIADWLVPTSGAALRDQLSETAALLASLKS